MSLFVYSQLLCREIFMRLRMLFCAVALASVAYAKEPAPYLTGTLVQMDAVYCGASDSAQKRIHEPLCQEYILQAENVTFRIRPRDEKHSVLLSVGNRAEFRMEKDKLMLRMEEANSKEREYVIISMTPRSDASAADAAPSHLNHLQ